MKTRRNTYNFNSKYKNEDESEGEQTINEIKVTGNNIYLYSDINQEVALNFNTQLKKLEEKLIIVSIQYDCELPNINIHINSEGGEVFSALSMVDSIKNCKVPITTIVEGQAASAATLISIVADTRKITSNSYMLIHQISSGFEGKHNEFKDEMKNLNRLMKSMKKIYKEYTNLDESKLDSCLKKDIWWSSKFCLDNGLVDEIV